MFFNKKALYFSTWTFFRALAKNFDRYFQIIYNSEDHGGWEIRAGI